LNTLSKKLEQKQAWLRSGASAMEEAMSCLLPTFCLSLIPAPGGAGARLACLPPSEGIPFIASLSITLMAACSVSVGIL
jgi:hypothetical protein